MLSQAFSFNYELDEQQLKSEIKDQNTWWWS